MVQKVSDLYFTSGVDNLRYKKLKTEIQNNCIMLLDGYPQDLTGFTKILNNYIT